jgi:hypothetical protein
VKREKGKRSKEGVMRDLKNPYKKTTWEKYN